MIDGHTTITNKNYGNAGSSRIVAFIEPITSKLGFGSNCLCKDVFRWYGN